MLETHFCRFCFLSHPLSLLSQGAVHSRSVFVTPWTVAHQAPLSMGILQARILEWVAFPFSRGIFPTQRSNPGLPHCRRILEEIFLLNLGNVFHLGSYCRVLRLIQGVCGFSGKHVYLWGWDAVENSSHLECASQSMQRPGEATPRLSRWLPCTWDHWLQTASTPPSRVSCLHVGARVPALLGLHVAAGAPAPPSVRVHGDVPDRFVRQPVHTYF